MGRNKSVALDDILDAAEDVLRTNGFRRFTQDLVVERAGISKGGLVYSYPTKSSLIQAMLERELKRFAADCEEKAKEYGDHPYAALLGYLKACQEEDEKTTQKAGNLMTTVLHAPEVLPVLQDYYRKNTKKFFDTATKSGRKAQLAFLSLEGMFFLKFLGLKKFTKKEWDAIISDARALLLE